MPTMNERLLNVATALAALVWGAALVAIAWGS